MNLRNNFSTDVAKKLLGNIHNATLFLLKLGHRKNIKLPFKTISKGVQKGIKKLDLNNNEIWHKIVEHWDFDISQTIIRDLFRETPKYQNGKESYETMKILMDEWEKLNLNKIAWPFSQGDFDGFVQRLNSEQISGLDKDKKVKNAAVKYRRIKEINTVRNDFIETLIFEKNKNILPTLNHNRGVDFYINGVSFDQKVAKSPTREFQKQFGEQWRDEAINNKAKVAEYLYKYQDEGRFGADNRLLVVYLDEDIEIQKIATIIQNTNLENPLEINFEYTHNKGKPTEKKKLYKVQCFVILLHN